MTPKYKYCLEEDSGRCQRACASVLPESGGTCEVRVLVSISPATLFGARK